MPLEIKQPFHSARELLPQMLHELAQPVSALQCSLEVALRRPRSLEDYLVALENAQEITNRLRARLEFFREFSEAGEPCDCMHPVDAAETIAAAIQEMQPLADSLGMTLEGECDSVMVYGNEQKFAFFVLQLLDAALASHQSTTVQWMTEDTIFGSLRVCNNDSSKRGLTLESLSLPQAALSTIGGEIFVQPLESGTLVKVRLAPYRNRPAER